MLHRPGQWPLAMAALPATGLGNGRSLPLHRPAQWPLYRSPYFHPQSVPVNERVWPIAAPDNGIDRTLPGIVGGILTATGLNSTAGGEDIERKVCDDENGAPNPMQEAVGRLLRRRACIDNHGIAVSLIVDRDSRSIGGGIIAADADAVIRRGRHEL